MYIRVDAAKWISVVVRSQSHRRPAAPQQLVHVQQDRPHAAARRRLIMACRRLVVARRRLVQVLQAQHLQGIHTCREEASQAGLLDPRVATGEGVGGATNVFSPKGVNPRAPPPLYL